MTVTRPYLALQRLKVRAGEHIVYDEIFHDGLNIIRGTNSSGKSTILDFIFYAMGGDVTVWKTAASKCTDVSAEMRINESVVTLHRKITSNMRSSMAIYWGSLEDSENHHFKNWTEYPYASRGENEGFSKVLFRLLGYPEVKSDMENNLTMHQLLRLVYVDQVSRTTSLMREEDWDTPLTRQTIAHLLFGVYDDTLYADELALKLRERELKDISLQVIHTADILEAVDEKLDAGELRKRLAKLASELDSTNDAVESAIEGTSRVQDTSNAETEKLRKTIVRRRTEIAQLTARIEELTLDIFDSEAFVENLNGRLVAIEESLVARDSLGDLPACPLCLLPVKQVNGEITCEFSGKKVPGDFGRSSMLKMREELRYQIAESTSLQKDRREELETLGESKTALAVQLEQLSRTYRQRTRAVKTARDNRLDELYQLKGRLEAEIQNATKLGKYLDVLAGLKRRESELKNYKGELEESIKSKRRKQRGRLDQAVTEIQQCVVEILSRDLKRQEEFSMVESLQLRFDKNTYLLNGRNNFSASSNAVLKNAIHFGIHFAATEDPEFRYPRFILCDNAEDGGMEKERSQKFQFVVSTLAKKATNPHQIILSTSMIHPDLESEEICVGPSYSEDQKSLNLPVYLQQAAVAAEEPSLPEAGPDEGG